MGSYHGRGWFDSRITRSIFRTCCFDGFIIHLVSIQEFEDPSHITMALLHLGLLFLVNLFIFTTYIITEIPDFFGASDATVAALKGCSNLLNVLTILQIVFIFTIFPSPIFSNRKTTFGLFSKKDDY